MTPRWTSRLFDALLLGLSLIVRQHLLALAKETWLEWSLSTAAALWCGWLCARILWGGAANEPNAQLAPSTSQPSAVVTATLAPAHASMQPTPEPPSESETVPWTQAFHAERSPKLLQLRSLASLGPGLKTFPLFEHTFRAPVEAVHQAVRRKYQPPSDPENPHVLSAMWQPEPAGHQRREVVYDVGASVPYLARRAAGMSERLVVDEHFEWQGSSRLLFAKVTNRDMRHIAVFQEVALFTPHPEDPSWTLYRSWLEISASNWAGQKMLALLPASPHQILAKHVAALEARLRAVAADAS